MSRTPGFNRFFKAVLVASTAMIAPGGIVVAQAQSTAQAGAVSFNIPSQSLTASLTAFARQTGIRIAYPAALASGKSAPALRGSFTSTEALGHILAGSGLAEARLSTSRYLIVLRKKTVAAAEVTVDASDDEVSFNLINVGPFVEGFSNAVRKAESLPHDGDYACHILRIAPLYVMALWLEPLDGGETIIVPIKPAPDLLLTADSYSEEEFLNALRQPALDLDTRI